MSPFRSALVPVSTGLLAVIALFAGLLAACDGRAPAPRASAPSPSPTPGAPSPTVDRMEALERLRDGGFVIYIRHTATESTRDDPTPDLADPDTQRLLSKWGRVQARRIGRAVRRLGIPVGRVLASPYHRTRETARLAFGRVEATDRLINEIYPGTDAERQARMLRGLLRERPRAATNTVLVSHGFNLDRATGLSSAEGDTVIFDPAGPLVPVLRIGIDEWRSLA